MTGPNAQSGDKSNLSVKVLSAVTVVTAIIGVIFLVKGLVGTSDRYGLSTVDGGVVSAGAVFLGFALQMWILLLFFWAWRWERRTHPAYTTPPPAPPHPTSTPSGPSPTGPPSDGMNRVQREAAEALRQQPAAETQ